MDGVIADAAAPLLREDRRFFKRPGLRRRKSQSSLKLRTQALVRGQPPVLPRRAEPAVGVGRVAVGRPHGHHPGRGHQSEGELAFFFEQQAALGAGLQGLGFLLQALLQAPPDPLLAFAEHFVFNLPQSVLLHARSR